MNTRRRFSIFEISLTLIILGIHLYAATADAYTLPNVWFRRDDAYYYFKVAQNITEGLGSTFDGINPSNGYHPLWMLICLPIFALARFDVILPLRILVMVIALIQSATVIMIYRLLKENLSQPVAILASMFWAFNIIIHSTVYELGLETPIAAFTIVLLLYKLSHFEKVWRTRKVTNGELIKLGLLSTLVLFSRLDLIFLALVTGFWIVLRGKPIRFLLPLDLFIYFASMTVSVALRTGITDYNNLYATSAVDVALIAIVIKVISQYFFGAYFHPQSTTLWKLIRSLLLSTSVASLTTFLIFPALAAIGLETGFPRSAFALDWAFSFGFTLFTRLLSLWFGNRQNQNKETPIQEFRAMWRIWATEGSAYFGIVGGFLALYVTFNKLVFGTWTPISGEIKRWWGILPNTVYDSPASSWTSFLGISPGGPFNAWQPLADILPAIGAKLRFLIPGADMKDERYILSLIIVSLITLILLAFNKKRTLHIFSTLSLLPLIAACGLQTLSYTATAYGGAKEWYWVGEMILITLMGSLCLDLILKPSLQIKTNRPAWNALAFLIGLMISKSLIDFVKDEMVHNFFPPDRAYMEVVEYLEENTPSGSIIGMTGGGNVGYLIKDRTIVNMDGLINSAEYLQALREGNAAPFLFDKGMRVVFANAQLLATPPYNGQFARYIARYDGYGGKSLLYLLEEPKYLY